MNQRKFLFLTLIISAVMITFAIVPVMAKPTNEMDVSIVPADIPDYYWITFTNTGGIRINIISITIYEGADDWGGTNAGGGWERTSYTATDVTYQASGKYVLGRGDSVTFEFKATLTPIQCYWSTANRKGVLNSDTFWYDPQA